MYALPRAVLTWIRETVRVSAWVATAIVGVTVLAIAAATGGASQGLVSLEDGRVGQDVGHVRHGVHRGPGTGRPVEHLL
jgi:hypothetical protein